jgi:hypothetical protein
MDLNSNKTTLPFRRLPNVIALLAITVLSLSAPYAGAFDYPPLRPPHSEDKSIFEARAGYLWGYNEFRFRLGNNSNIAPGKKSIILDSPVFGLMGGTFVMKDLAIRGQASINVPLEWRNDFILDGRTLAWDTAPRLIEADLAAIYHFGLGGMPYSAGLLGGYRFYKYDTESHRVNNSSSNASDHMQIHIPYLGVYYTNANLVGSLVRLDLIWSPIILSRLDAVQFLTSSPAYPSSRLEIEGVSLTGQFYELLFEWSAKLSKSAFAGAYLKYNFMDASAHSRIRKTQASQQQMFQETDYLTDMKFNVIETGLAVTFTF